MSKTKDDVEEDVEKEEDERLVLKFDNYRILAETRQYILRKWKGTYDKSGKEQYHSRTLYHRCLADCLSSIYEWDINEKVRDSKTLDEAVRRIRELNKEMIEKIKCLEGIEDLDYLWKVIKPKNNN